MCNMFLGNLSFMSFEVFTAWVWFFEARAHLKISLPQTKWTNRIFLIYQSYKILSFQVKVTFFIMGPSPESPHTYEKQPIQVWRRRAHAGRKFTQVGNELPQAGRSNVPSIWTLGSRVRTNTPYHSGKESFLSEGDLELEGAFFRAVQRLGKAIMQHLAYANGWGPRNQIR